MSQLQIFSYQERQVRTVEKNGEPWFVAKDVCEVLEIGNSRDAIGRLDDDEKGVVSTDTLGGLQEMGIVSESGLYSLVLGSRKPEAKMFKRWITHEVIPAIRKTGAYSVALLPPSEILALQVRVMRELEASVALVKAEVTETKDKLEEIKDSIVLNPGSWRKDTARWITKVAQARSVPINDVYSESYELLERKAGVNLKLRLENMRKNAALEGVSKSRREQMNRLDVIASDKKLREIYPFIVQQMAVKYG